MKKNAPIPPEVEQKIVSNYKRISIHQLSIMLGVSRQTIRRAAERNGLVKKMPHKEVAFEDRKVAIWGYVKRKHYGLAQKALKEAIKQYR